ncbi:hypothetical protein KQY30_32695 [Streptomyces sp. GMY02]|uniref:hypothetical protein n=1 Tax=Streptomyces sp. GMY02 TaxID=1333528 RepID=UPI001C2C33F8|nr:hypothetical protein [Streptomyces sp. GMY02]QXE38286.1 hypothetical protein KQY30_32695 [Streptomyces sp. GMY02]
MTAIPDNQPPNQAAPTTVLERRPRKRRRAWEGIKDFLVETVGEIVFDAVVQVVSCALLVGVVVGLVWGWRRSPELTLGATAVLLTGALAAVTAWRHPGPLRAKRMLATGLTALLVLAGWFILYGSNCQCF